MAKDQGAVSFDPGTFTSGKWDGGRGTVVADPPPRFEYRPVPAAKPFTVVEAHLSIEDREGEVHDVKWQAGYEDQLIIRESNDSESDPVEQGPSIFAREPGKQIRLRAQEEWSQFLASLQTQGYASAKLNKGDLSVFVGMDAEWVQFARKKDDKYPILVVSELFDKKGGKSSTSAGTSTKSTSAKPAAKSTKGKDADDDDSDSDSPYAGRDAEEVALEIALEVLNSSEEPTTNGTTVGDVSRIAYKKLKGETKLRKEVMDLIGADPAMKGAWIKSQDEFKYKKSTNSIVLVED